MTSGKKKVKEVKPVEEKASEEVKPSVEAKPSEKISLIVFKETQGMDAMTYAGFKAALKAEDNTEYTQAELENKLEEYKAQNAFIKK